MPGILNIFCRKPYAMNGANSRKQQQGKWVLGYSSPLDLTSHLRIPQMPSETLQGLMYALLYFALLHWFFYIPTFLSYDMEFFTH